LTKDCFLEAFIKTIKKNQYSHTPEILLITLFYKKVEIHISDNSTNHKNEKEIKHKILM
jgi:hypothetical protein